VRCCAKVMLGRTRTHAGRHNVKVAIASRDCVTRIASQDERCRACEESFVCSDGDHAKSTNIACFGYLVAYDEFSTGYGSVAIRLRTMAETSSTVRVGKLKRGGNFSPAHTCANKVC
jgi:hypothetical protein